MRLLISITQTSHRQDPFTDPEATHVSDASKALTTIRTICCGGPGRRLSGRSSTCSPKRLEPVPGGLHMDVRRFDATSPIENESGDDDTVAVKPRISCWRRPRPRHVCSGPTRVKLRPRRCSTISFDGGDLPHGPALAWHLDMRMPGLLVRTLGARGESPAAFDRRCIAPGRRCSSVTNAQFAPSSRLARHAQRRSRCNAGFHHGLLEDCSSPSSAYRSSRSRPRKPTRPSTHRSNQPRSWNG